ncbi:baseplate J/gp47 family protein [Paenibacillus sp. TAB 01]|uniref:baseplate assembly protein n=1 Tax=Paenibacillus sp. TAB 01 TaxID=3368988 RepID=UPI003753D85A
MIDQTAKQRLLRYASSEVLDHIGAFSETARLQAAAARTTIRFVLSAAQQSPVPIPQGTRLSVNKIYFQTTSYQEVPAGEQSIDIEALCMTPGTIGNGFLPGQITQIVDPIAFVSQAFNITASSGGTDVEDDESYRQRLHEAPESFSVAGPDGAYRHWAKTVSTAIVDVAVFSPAQGVVQIIPLMEGGEVPSQDILDAVASVCNDRKVRPLTDQVIVSAPNVVPYDLEATYWIDASDAADVPRIQAAIGEAVTGFVTWQKSKLGRSINPSELTRRVMQAGARRVDITGPLHQVIDGQEVAIAENVQMTYGGLEDD